jgi:hypothetical protein
MLYLRLFHGRNSMKEEMDDWGFDGPIIGPLQWCHTTYACDVKLALLGNYDSDYDLPIVGGCLKFEGKYYGDWSVFYSEVELPPAVFKGDTQLILNILKVTQ